MEETGFLAPIELASFLQQLVHHRFLIVDLSHMAKHTQNLFCVANNCSCGSQIFNIGNLCPYTLGNTDPVEIPSVEHQASSFNSSVRGKFCSRGQITGSWSNHVGSLACNYSLLLKCIAGISDAMAISSLGQRLTVPSRALYLVSSHRCF